MLAFVIELTPAVRKDSRLALRKGGPKLRHGMETNSTREAIVKAKILFAAGMTAVAAFAGAAQAQYKTQGVTKDEILIGSHIDLSGPIAEVGRAARGH